MIKLLPPRLNKFKTTIELRSRLDTATTTDTDYHQLWSRFSLKEFTLPLEISRAPKRAGG